MRRNRMLRPPAVERERFERLRLILDWLNHDFIDSQQCFWELLLVLGRFRHMKTRALAEDDVTVVQTFGASCDWIAFRHSVRRAVWNQLQASTELFITRSFVAPRAPHYLKTLASKEGVFFEYQVGIFPTELKLNKQFEPQNVQRWLQQYLLDVFFGDLVGMSTQAIGSCHECNTIFINRRAIFRQFCGARCRWKNAAREKQKAEELAKLERERATRATRFSRRRSLAGSALVRKRRLPVSSSTPSSFAELIKRISEKSVGGSGPWPEKRQEPELPAPKGGE